MNSHCETRSRADALLRLSRAENLAKAVGARAAKPPSAARRSSACRSSSPRSTSARSRITNTSSSPRRFPGRARRRSAQLAQRARRGHRRLALREARRGALSQHRGDHRRRRHVPRQVPQDAHPGRPALLREVLLHARRSRLPRVADEVRARSASASAGTSGTRRPRGSPRLRGAQILFYPTAIGWHPARESASTARGSTTRGRRSSARTPSPMAATSRCRIASATKRRMAATGIEFWGQSFVADPSGQIVAKASADEEEILVVEVDLDALDTQRTHWPFFRDRRIDAYGGHRRSDSSTDRMSAPARTPTQPSPVSRRAAAIACRRSGSRTKPRGFPGRGRDGISFPDSYERVMPALAKMVARARRFRAGEHQRVRRGARRTLVRSHLAQDRARIRARHLPSHPHQRAVVPRSRPDFPHARRRAAARRSLDWDYNAWGWKYPPFDDDDVVPTRIAEMLGLPVYRAGHGARGRLDRGERRRHAAHHASRACSIRTATRISRRRRSSSGSAIISA